MTAIDELLSFGTAPLAPLPGRRLLYVHAHPDDEASKGAATAARYADEGARVTLVTCTGGEAGEILNEAMAHVAIEEIPSVRAAELAESVRVLGFAAAYQLGYPDSGWHEDLDDVPDGRFWGADVDEAGGRLATILRAERPQVVVTYPEDGGYPHPDHIKVHAVTMRAVDLAADAGHTDGHAPWRVPKVYASTVYPRPKLEALHAAHESAGLDSPFGGWLERDRPEEPLSAMIEVGDWLQRRDDALRAHATQIDPAGFWFLHDRDIERRVAPWEGFILLRSDPPVVPTEDDLFAGIDG